MDSHKHNNKICIVGAGLVGSLLATLLTKEGFAVDVYEKRVDPRIDTKTQGRSIALNLSFRGWKALEEAGLDQVIRVNTKPAFGRAIHEKYGTTHLQDYGDGTEAIWTINRNLLNRTLIDKAQNSGLALFFFEHALESLDEDSGEVVFIDSNKKERITKKYDYIIGVDGIFSTVRKNLERKKLLKFTETKLPFGYKELCISQEANGQKLSPDNRTHIWPRRNSLLIAFPTFEGGFVSTLFLPLTGRDSFETLTNLDVFKEFLEREFGDLVPFLYNLESNFLNNPNSTITQVSGGPWHHKGKVLIMGDAAHAITPFYGMGMNIGFEDCTEFMRILKENNFDFSKTFKEVEDIRKPNTDAMTELSFDNFQSISESPDPTYQVKWVLERKIWKMFPEVWSPIYLQITSSQTPIGEIPAIKKWQDDVINSIVRMNPYILSLYDEEIKKIVAPYLRSKLSKLKNSSGKKVSITKSIFRYIKGLKGNSKKLAKNAQ